MFAPEIQNINKIMANKEIVYYFDWQSRGHRFDSDMLHIDIMRLSAFFKCWLFFSLIHDLILFYRLNQFLRLFFQSRSPPLFNVVYFV